MEKHIIAFDKEVNELLSQFKGNLIIEEYKKYKSIWAQKSHYFVVDSFTFELGLGMSFIPVYELKDNEKLLGFEPKIKYYPQNVFGKEASTVAFSNNISIYKSLAKCYSFMARQFFYLLLTACPETVIKFLSKKRYE